MNSLFNPSQLYEILAQYGGLPQWARQRPYTAANGEYDTLLNRVVAQAPEQNSQKDKSTGTLSHEMAHAVQYQLFYDAASRIQAKIREKEKVTDEERRFLDSAQKMFIQGFGTVGMDNPRQREKRKDSLDAAVKALYGDKKDSYDSYRTSPEELQAFGVGRMTKGGSVMHGRPDSGNGHLDPSFATEFALLLEQFKSLPESVKQRKGTRDESIKKNREYEDSKRNFYEFSDITSDPFKPTIK